MKRKNRSTVVKCSKCRADMTLNASGLCKDCRTMPCIDCGQKFLAQNMRASVFRRCADCAGKARRKQHTALQGAIA